MTRTLILSQVLAVRDFHVTYPCCITCYSKVYQEQDRWQCVKCSRSLITNNVQARYRLNLHITDHQTECDVTVFGKQLEAYFGASATVFARYAEDARAHLSVEAVNHAINKAFVGRVFLFGFRGRGTSSYHVQHGPSKLASIVEHTVPSMSQSSQVYQHKACRVNIIAWQMIRPNAKEKLSTVIDHLQEQYRPGKEEEFDISSAESSLELSPMSSFTLSGASHRFNSTLDYTDNFINKVAPGFQQSLHLSFDKSLDWDTSLKEKDFKHRMPSILCKLSKRKCSPNETEEHKQKQIIASKHKQYKPTSLSENLASESASFSNQSLSIGIHNDPELFMDHFQNGRNYPEDEERNDIHMCTGNDRRKVAVLSTLPPLVNKRYSNVSVIDMSSDSNDDDEQNSEDCWDMPESEDLDAFLRNLTAVVTEYRKEKIDNCSHAISYVKNDRKHNPYVPNINNVSTGKRNATFGFCEGLLNLTSAATNTQSFKESSTGINNSYPYSLIGNCLEGPGHCAVFATNSPKSKITDQIRVAASETFSQITNEAPYSEDLSAFLRSMAETDFNESPPTEQNVITRESCDFDDRSNCKITNISDEKIHLNCGKSSVNFKATEHGDLVHRNSSPAITNTLNSEQNPPGSSVANDLETTAFDLPPIVTHTVQPNLRKYLNEKYDENITAGEERDLSTIDNSQEDITGTCKGSCTTETNNDFDVDNSMQLYSNADPLLAREKPLIDTLKDERTNLDYLGSCVVLNDTPDASSNSVQRIAHELHNEASLSNALQISNQDKSFSGLSNDRVSQDQMNIEMEIPNQEKLLANSLDVFDVIKNRNNSRLPNNLASQVGMNVNWEKPHLEKSVSCSFDKSAVRRESQNRVNCKTPADLSKISIATINCSDDMFRSYSEEQPSFRSEEQLSLFDLPPETVNSVTDLEKRSHPPSPNHLTKRASTARNNGSVKIESRRKGNLDNNLVRRSVHFARRLSSVASVTNIDLRMTFKTPIPLHRGTRRKSCLKENAKPRQDVEIKPDSNVDLFQKNSVRIIAGSQDLFTPSPGSSLCPRNYASDSDDEILCQSTPLFQTTSHRKQSELAIQQSGLTLAVNTLNTKHTSHIKDCTHISPYYLPSKSHIINTSSGALKSDTSHLNLIKKSVSYKKNDAENDNTVAIFDSEISDLFDTSGELFSSYDEQKLTSTCETYLLPQDSSSSVLSQKLRTSYNSNRGTVSTQNHASDVVSFKTTEEDFHSVKFDRSLSQDLFDDSLGFDDTRNELVKKLF